MHRIPGGLSRRVAPSFALLWVAVLVVGVLLGDCVGSGIKVKASRQTVTSQDGFPLLTYRLTEGRKEREPRGLLFYIQGSSCASALYAAEMLAGAPAAGIPVVIAERRGVNEEEQVDEEVCLEASAKERRVSDHLAVISAYLDGLPRDLPVLVVGASEGGDVASAVAAREPRITHLVLLATGGGWTQEEEIRFLLSREKGYLGLESPEELDEVLGKIRQDPEALTMWAGNPYRRWSSYLWDPPAKALLGLGIPIFLAHGRLDTSVPVESARALRDAFAQAGKDNLTYQEYPEADHGFYDPRRKRSLAPRIEADLVRWLERHGVVTPVEARELTRRIRKNHPEIFSGTSSQEEP